MLRIIIFVSTLLIAFNVQAIIGYVYIPPPIIVQPPPQTPDYIGNFMRAREERAYLQKQQLEQQNLQLQNQLLQQQIEANNQKLSR